MTGYPAASSMEAHMTNEELVSGVVKRWKSTGYYRRCREIEESLFGRIPSDTAPYKVEDEHGRLYDVRDFFGVMGGAKPVEEWLHANGWVLSFAGHPRSTLVVLTAQHPLYGVFTLPLMPGNKAICYAGVVADLIDRAQRS